MSAFPRLGLAPLPAPLLIEAQSQELDHWSAECPFTIYLVAPSALSLSS